MRHPRPRSSLPSETTETHAFFYSMAPKVKHSKKGHKDKAVKRKEEHKIKWNPNSAHKNEKIQQWTKEKMVETIKLFSTGAYSQRKIAKMVGIHVSTLNKHFRGLVKGTGHRLGGCRMPRVLKEGTLRSSETLCVSLSHVSVAFTDPNTIISFFSRGRKGACSIGHDICETWISIYRAETEETGL